MVIPLIKVRIQTDLLKQLKEYGGAEFSSKAVNQAVREVLKQPYQDIMTKSYFFNYHSANACMLIADEKEALAWENSIDRAYLLNAIDEKLRELINQLEGGKTP